MFRIDNSNRFEIPWLSEAPGDKGLPPSLNSAGQQLRRAVLACILWEKQFYEDGVIIGERIHDLVPRTSAAEVAELAVEARERLNLRRAPLWLVREMARLASHRHLVAETLNRVIHNAGELCEFVALYWSEGKQPLSAQVKKGLAAALNRFDEQAVAKHNRAETVTLRDVLFLCHARPLDSAQAELWKRLAEDELSAPESWESVLSACSGERDGWERLLAENRLDSEPLLRNLRALAKAQVSDAAVRGALARMETQRVPPFRFIAAACNAPQWEIELESAMLRALKHQASEGQAGLLGKTVLVVDVSGSMDAPLSRRSTLRRHDAACGLAMLLREMGEVSVYTFSDGLVPVPPQRGFGLRNAINASQPHRGTAFGKSLAALHQTEDKDYDRLIVITDEQSHETLPDPRAPGFLINVAAFQIGVRYGPWTYIDGWSESVIDYISAATSG